MNSSLNKISLSILLLGFSLRGDLLAGEAGTVYLDATKNVARFEDFPTGSSVSDPSAMAEILTTDFLYEINPTQPIILSKTPYQHVNPATPVWTEDPKVR